MRYVGLALIVIVVIGAFNAAGDIGPAIDLLAFLFVFRHLGISGFLTYELSSTLVNTRLHSLTLANTR